MVLEGKDITFRYKKNGADVLTNVHIALTQGDRVGLIAPSGMGKTTLCKILAGYEQPDSGLVTLDGRPLGDYQGYCPVQMIWQHPEHVINPRLKMGAVLAEAGIVDQNIFRELGIEKSWLRRFPSELSGGEMQRFCVARALSAHTKFIIADEISTMLDLITQSQLWYFLLGEAKKRNIGLLVVSHSQPLLDYVCEKQYDLRELYA